MPAFLLAPCIAVLLLTCALTATAQTVTDETAPADPLPAIVAVDDAPVPAAGQDAHLVIPAGLFAADQEGKPPTPAHTGLHALFGNVVDDFRHLPSRENLGWTVFGTAAGLSVHPFDGSVNRHLVGKSAVHHFFLPGKVIGEGYVQVGASLATYAYGRLFGEPRVSHIGMDLLRAQILVGALTYALKIAVRRERPDGSNNQSFPSGHAAVTFATALVLQRHFGWWSVPTFLVASYTATSRLHENVHYLSDVVAGAAIGVIAGRTVTRHGRSSFAFAPVLGRGEVALLIQRQVGR